MFVVILQLFCVLTFSCHWMNESYEQRSCVSKNYSITRSEKLSQFVKTYCKIVINRNNNNMVTSYTHIILCLVNFNGYLSLRLTVLNSKVAILCYFFSYHINQFVIVKWLASGKRDTLQSLMHTYILLLAPTYYGLKLCR